MKTYDLICTILQKKPELRNSDKALCWEIWSMEGKTKAGLISKYDFLTAEHFETIRRTRQKVQEDHPELKSNEQIEEQRKAIERTKGTFVYRNETEVNNLPF